jgi:hypothetical protein
MVMYSNCQRIEVLSGDPTSKSRVSWMVEYHLHLVVFLELNILHTYTTCRHTYLCASDSLSFSYCWFCRWACISCHTNWMANVACNVTGLGMVGGMQSFFNHFQRLAYVTISVWYNCSELHHHSAWRVNTTGQCSHSSSTHGTYMYPCLVV